MGTANSRPTIIKVKVYGAYRPCILLRVYRSKTTGEAGYVDVRVRDSHVCYGMPSVWEKVPIARVRKADHDVVKGALPPKVAA